MLSTRGTTALLLIAAAAATIAKKCLWPFLHPLEAPAMTISSVSDSGTAPTVDALGAILPWGEGEEGAAAADQSSSLVSIMHVCFGC